MQFAWFVLVDLVVSTGAVAREILTPTDFTEEAIIAVEVPTSARRHLLLLLVAITVTPGTAVVDTDGERGTLYLHLLHCDRRAAVTAHIDRLAALAGAALPPPSLEPGGPEMIVTIVLAVFVLTGACAAARALRGPTLADRVAAFDVGLIALMGGIVTQAVDTGDTVALDLLVVVAIVGFTATVAVSRFVERQGSAR